MEKYVKYDEEGVVGILTIDRQEALNALNGEVLMELAGAIARIEEKKELRALIITGAGRSFVAGADIAAMGPMNMTEGRDWGRLGASVFRRIELLEIPTIAAVNGFALGGGCELAMACDLILASEKAKFGQPEVTLGITPGFSGTQRLARRAGVARAKELIFTGDMISAQEAARIGLVNRVTPPEELMNEAKALAARIAANAPLAVKYSKAAIDRGMQGDIDSGIGVENEFFALCFATEDQKSGMKAFLAKEKAVFEGK
jgi:enoyl-CoA hydratase